MEIEEVRNGIQIESEGRKWLITAELQHDYEYDYEDGGKWTVTDVKLHVHELPDEEEGDE